MSLEAIDGLGRPDKHEMKTFLSLLPHDLFLRSFAINYYLSVFRVKRLKLAPAPLSDFWRRRRGRGWFRLCFLLNFVLSIFATTRVTTPMFVWFICRLWWNAHHLLHRKIFTKVKSQIVEWLNSCYAVCG